VLAAYTSHALSLSTAFNLWQAVSCVGIDVASGSGSDTGILLLGPVHYLNRNGPTARKIGTIIFVAALVLIQTSNTFLRPPPSSDRAFAITALVFYTVFAAIAFLLEKRRVIPS